MPVSSVVTRYATDGFEDAVEARCGDELSRHFGDDGEGSEPADDWCLNAAIHCELCSSFPYCQRAPSKHVFTTSTLPCRRHCSPCPPIASVLRSHKNDVPNRTFVSTFGGGGRDALWLDLKTKSGSWWKEIWIWCAHCYILYCIGASDGGSRARGYGRSRHVSLVLKLHHVQVLSRGRTTTSVLTGERLRPPGRQRGFRHARCKTCVRAGGALVWAGMTRQGGDEGSQVSRRGLIRRRGPTRRRERLARRRM